MEMGLDESAMLYEFGLSASDPFAADRTKGVSGRRKGGIGVGVIRNKESQTASTPPASQATETPKPEQTQTPMPVPTPSPKGDSLPSDTPVPIHIPTLPPPTQDPTPFSDWEKEVIKNLKETRSPEGIHAAQYLSDNNISFGNLTWQLASSAAWRFDGSISFDSRDYDELPDPNSIETLSLVAHEAKHLEQGPVTAL